MSQHKETVSKPDILKERLLKKKKLLTPDKNEIKSRGAISIEALNKLKNTPDQAQNPGKSLSILGLVTDIVHRVTRSGNKYGEFIVEDYSGKTMLSLFTEDYLKFSPFFELNGVVHIEGYFKRRYNRKEVEFKITRISRPPSDLSILGEPVPGYPVATKLPSRSNFSYPKFARIAAMVPFSQREWAAIFHLSEKTLQRYAKDNKSFEGIYVDRIFQIKELIELGLEAFITPEALYEWLKKDKPVLGHLLNFDSLSSTQGIQLLKDELGRILHGIYI